MKPLEVPELVDRIIDHIHDDEPALRATSLVARLWLAASQYHLLHTCKLEVDGDLDTAGKIQTRYEDLHASKHLAANIVVLRIDWAQLHCLSEVRSIVNLTRDLPQLQDLLLTRASFAEAQEDCIPLLRGREKLRLLKIATKDYNDGNYLITLLQAYPSIGTLIVQAFRSSHSGLLIFPHAKLPNGVLVHQLVVTGYHLRDVYPPTALLLQALGKNSPRKLSFTVRVPIFRNGWREMETMCTLLGPRLDEVTVNMRSNLGTPFPLSYSTYTNPSLYLELP